MLLNLLSFLLLSRDFRVAGAKASFINSKYPLTDKREH